MRRRHFMHILILSTLALMAYGRGFDGTTALCRVVDDPLYGPNRERVLRRYYPFQPNPRYLHRIRVVYFVPNDRPNRLGEIGNALRENIASAVAFFADERRLYGIGTKDPELVRDRWGQVEIVTVVGNQPLGFYTSSDATRAIASEIDERFAAGELDIDRSTSIVVLYIEKESSEIDGAGGIGSGGSDGGTMWLPVTPDHVPDWSLTAHELGHAFGLNHNFNSDRFIMSYGRDPDRLAAVHAHFLATHRYFNDRPTWNEDTWNADVRVTGPDPFAYDATTDATELTFEVFDPEGISQVFFLTTAGDVFPLAEGSFLVYWNGERFGGGTTRMDYSVVFYADPPPDDPLPPERGGDGIGPIWTTDGVPAQTHRGREPGFTHRIAVKVMDMEGSFTFTTFYLVERSPGQHRVLVVGEGTDEYAELTDALHEAIRGDTIEIRSNRTFEWVSFDATRSGITVRAAGGYRPVLSRTSVRGARDLVFDGLTFTSVDGTGLYIAETSSLTARDAVFEKSDTGIYVRDGSTVIVEGGKIAENTWSGLYLESATAELNDVDIARNGSNGVYMSDAPKVVLNNTRIVENGASGIQIRSSELRMTGGIIQANEQSGVFVDGGVAEFDGVEILANDGSGVSADSDSEVTVRKARISENTSTGVHILSGKLIAQESTISQSGDIGIYVGSSADVTLRDVNVTESESVGLFVEFSALNAENVVIQDSLRSGFYARHASIDLRGIDVSRNEGSGIVIDGGSVVVNRLTGRDNRSTGVWLENATGPTDGRPILANSLIVENTDGVVFKNVSGRIVNATIARNANVGMWALDNAEVVVQNSILWANTAASYATRDGGVANFFRSILPDVGGFPAVPGDENIGRDPLFVDAMGGDYRLLPGSPAIDAGSDAYVDTSGTDIDGNPRRLGSSVDIGAYESEIRTPWDTNGDGIVDILDLVTVAQAFGQVGEGRVADVNRDGRVDIVDLVTVAAHFGEVAGGAIAAPRTPTPSAFETILGWLEEARRYDDGSALFDAGIRTLDALLAAASPRRTALLPNYPNPFNPETWIPFDLREAAEVTITIYDGRGRLVTQLDLGRREAGVYRGRHRAAYWDGRNDAGERVASGVYYVAMEAGEYRALRRLVVAK